MDLSKLSLQELWQLFPIVLTEHRPEWAQWAAEEMKRLKDLLGENALDINHIGSTAIPGIVAKPIVDILVETPVSCDRQKLKALMVAADYICMDERGTRMSFNKGYTPEGFARKVFHIHVREIGDNAEIAFRDYLLSHPQAAHEYELLKLSLLPQYKYNRDGYTEAKTAFVQIILNCNV